MDGDTSSHKIESAAKTSASSSSFADEANDFAGKACPIQPQSNQLLVMSRLPLSSGCDLQTFDTPPTGASGSSGLSGLDVMKLYQELRPSVDYFVVKGKSDGHGKEAAGVDKVWGGSGVAIAEENNDCLVITDDHVPKGVPDMHVNPTEVGVVMPNGVSYKAEVVTSDPAHDLALVKVETGADTQKVCKPAAVVEQQVGTDNSVDIVSLGQPYTSHSIYTSSGSLSSTDKRSSISYMLKPLPGEDPNRAIYNMFMPIREGYSGAAVFDQKGQVIAIDDLATSPFSSVSTPIDRTVVDSLLARRTDKPNSK